MLFRSVFWELDHIAQNNLFGKTVFLLPARENIDREWLFLERQLRDSPWLPALAQIRSPGVRAFYFGARHNAVAFSSSKATDLAYRLAAQFAIYGLKAHEAERSGQARSA